MKTTTENANKKKMASSLGNTQNTPGEPTRGVGGIRFPRHRLYNSLTAVLGNRFPRAPLYDFLTLTVRTPQEQLDWGKILKCVNVTHRWFIQFAFAHVMCVCMSGRPCVQLCCIRSSWVAHVRPHEFNACVSTINTTVRTTKTMKLRTRFTAPVHQNLSNGNSHDDVWIVASTDFR